MSFMRRAAAWSTDMTTCGVDFCVDSPAQNCSSLIMTLRGIEQGHEGIVH